MTSAGPRWLLSRARRAEPSSRLYCFPHSGGSPGEYLRWSARLPGIGVYGVQPPGRGSRLREPPVTAMADLVAALAEQVVFEPPYAFFGHSLGSLVAYETARKLRDRGMPGPDLLCVSAQPAPELHDNDPGVAGLDDADLIAAVQAHYEKLPSEIHEDQELRQLMLGALRADLEIVAGYRPAPVQPLDCPILAMGGTQDQITSVTALSAWRHYTKAQFTLRLFSGGHFYFREHSDAVLHLLHTAITGSS